MQDIDSIDAVFTGERTDSHFSAGSTIGELKERPSLAPLAVVPDFRCTVETTRKQRDPAQIGLLDEIGKGERKGPHPHLAFSEVHIGRGAVISTTSEIDKT